MILSPIEDVVAAAERRPESQLAGVKFAQGGYAGGGEPIKGRLQLLEDIKTGDTLYAYRGGKCVGEFSVSVETAERNGEIFDNLKL